MTASVHQPCWADALRLWFDPRRIWYAFERAGLDGAMVRRDGKVVGLRESDGEPAPVALPDDALVNDVRAIAHGVRSVFSLPADAPVAVVTVRDLRFHPGRNRCRDALMVLAPGMLVHLPIWGVP